MSLTRYLPTPSDRMGILWTLLQIKDAVILEYGTAGTTAYATKTLMMDGLDVEGKLFTTGMSEDDVVMGDVSRLEQSLLNLDKTYQPKVIFVMTSSVASVTGSDVKGVCRYMQEQVKAQIVVFPQGGFSGDFSGGRQAAYTSLVEHLAVEHHPIINTYSILGQLDSKDADTVSRVMTAAFGLTSHCILCQDTTLANIQTLSRANVNLVVSYEGLQVADLLKNRFGTPYVYGIPVGKEGLSRWLEQVSEALRAEVKSIPNLPHNTLLSSKKVAAYADYDQLLAIHQLAEEDGVEIQFLLCTHSLKHVPNPLPEVLYCKTEREKIKMFEGLRDTLVLGDGTFWGHLEKSNRAREIDALI